MLAKLSLSAAALAAAIAVATLPGTAANMSGMAPLKGLALDQPSVVEKAHFWHRSCKKGLTDWHKHVPGIGRVTCTTKICKKNSYGVLRCRWY